MRVAPVFRYMTGSMVLAAACFWPAPARAEMDFEFAKALLERDEPSFQTDDMIQRLIVRLEANATSAIDAKLIKATVKRKQSEGASAEKRTNLLNEADALYKEILAGDKAHRLYLIAEKDAGTIINDRIGATLKAAKELEATDPAKSRSMRSDAASQMDKLAAPHKAIVDTAEPEFKKHFEAFTKWKEKNDPNDEGKQIPREIEDPLGKSFDTWVIADKKYISAKVKQLDCYDDNDQTKKGMAEELAKYVQTRLDYEPIGFFPVILAWYNFMQGRIYASVQNAEKAAEAWNGALSVETTNLGDDLKKQMFMLKKLILHDLVKMKMKGGKYGDVEGIIVEAMMEPNLKTLFDEDSGKELIIDYARALTLQVQDSSGAAEYEKAIKKLREMIEKETKGGAQTVWANQYSRTMAEILEDARKKGVRPRLDADEWYSAARGFFLMGQQQHQKYKEFKKDAPEKAKEQFEKAYSEFQNAVDFYRRAIAKARSLDTELSVRLDIEPKAWFEMGLSYVKMEHYYEAIIVNQAMRTTFLPDFRKKWMPDPTKRENARVYSKGLNELIAELDKKDGLLTKSGTNVMYALEENAKAHSDLWNKRLKGIILEQDTTGTIAGEGNVSDKDYLAAKVMAEEAKALVEQAKGSPDAKTAEGNFMEASSKYISAAERFSKVASGSQAYEIALYQVASNYTLSQALWAAYRFPSKNTNKKDEPNPQELMAAELAKKALAAFDKYSDHAAKNPVKGEDEKATEEKERRSKLEGAVMLARPTLMRGVATVSTGDAVQPDWINVVKAADEYVVFEQRVPQARSSIDNALLNKFQALVKLAALNFAPKCDPYLAEADKTMKELRKLKPNDNKLYGNMLDLISSRYNIAAFQAEKFIKEGKMPEDSERPYEDKVAELQAIRVDMREDEKDNQPKLEDYSRLVYLFNRSNMKKRAADMAMKMLKTFDPENKNVKIPDDEKIWKGMLARMVGDVETGVKGIITYTDINKESRCKRDHQILIDYMYDTTQGVNAAKPEDRPANDKHNMDMARAQAQLETIFNNYKDVQTKNMGEKGPDGIDKPYLKLIEEEIDFRRKIEAARDLLSTLSLAVAEVEAKAGNAESANMYRGVAYEQVGILQMIRKETPQMKIKMAEIAISREKYEDALNLLYEVRNNEERNSPLYFDSSKMIADVYRRQGKWAEAADFPVFLAVTNSLSTKIVKDKWPDIDQFLEECYKNGVQRPVIEKTADKKDPEKKDLDKKEEKKDEKTDPKDVKKDEPKEEKKDGPPAEGAKEEKKPE